MIFIGEKLNSSIKETYNFMKNKDEASIIDIIKLQEKGGADYIDINTAAFGNEELQVLRWVLQLVINNSDCGIMLDSSSPDVLLAALEYAGDRKVILNSVTLEQIDKYIKKIAELDVQTVFLPIDGGKITPDYSQRIQNIDNLINKLKLNNMKNENILIDALVQPISIYDSGAKVCIDCIKYLKEKGIKSICGASNVSFGLPNRADVNMAFLANATYAGLDYAILDAANRLTGDVIFASEAISGIDEFCMNYINRVKS